MVTVNKYALDVLLIPLTGLADDDDFRSPFDESNFSSLEKVKSIYTHYLGKHLSSYNDQLMELTENTLGYYLANNVGELRRAYHSCLTPFDLGDDEIDLLFKLVWEENFIKDYSSFFDAHVEFDHDLNAPQKLFYS